MVCGLGLIGCSDDDDDHRAPSCQDNDKDGYGNPASSTCTYLDLDCNDSDPLVHPGVTEVIGNGKDDDCNSSTKDQGPLLEKALLYSQNFQDFHSPAFGCSLEVDFDPDEESLDILYHDQGDSTIWTGNYVAAESYRYAVTKDPQAKEFGLRSVECLLAMEEVSGKPGFIARWVGPAEPPFLVGDCNPEKDCHIITEGPYAGNYWKGNTSSDQYLGWWYGVSHAYEFLLESPADEPLRQRIRDAMSRVLNTLRSEDYLIIDPDGTVSTAGPEIVGNEALAFHLVAADAVGGYYKDIMPTVYSEQAFNFMILTWYPITRWYQYYAFHLGHMAMHMMLRHEKDSSSLEFYRKMHRERLYTLIAHTEQVMFDYIAFGEMAVEQEPAILSADRQALHAFPDPPKRRIQPAQGPFEYDPMVDTLNEIIDCLEELLGSDIGNVGPQAKDPFPIEERCVSGFRWQTRPYEICGGSDPAFEYPGEDYLIAYWLGRYYGFIDATD